MKTLNDINWTLTRKSDNEKFEIQSIKNNSIFIVNFDNVVSVISFIQLNEEFTKNRIK